MIAGAGMIDQCKEGIEELEESATASEDAQEEYNDEVKIRKSPSGASIKQSSKVVHKQG